MKRQPIDAKLTGKVALVTGATGGIGKEIARGLAGLGAHVIIGARSMERGEATKKELGGETSVMELDVASFASTRAFADTLRKQHTKLDLLVNNAGIWLTDRKESPDGHELTLATNVLGPYLLTTLLADVLKAGAPSRVVNIVSSFASDYDATDLEFKRRKFDGFKAYGQSKAALRMLTWAFARRFAGTGVTVNAAAPGFVKTDFNKNAHGFTATMIGISAALFAVSASEGADTPLWVAAAKEHDGVTGRYFDKRKSPDGKWSDAAMIAELERQCAEMTGAPLLEAKLASSTSSAATPAS